jgi:hypothetical protein
MALEFMCGFDYLDTTTLTAHFTANSGAVQTSVVRNGTKAWLTLGAIEALYKTGLSNAATRVLGFGYYTSILGGEARCFVSIADGTPGTSGNNQISLVRATDGKISAYRGLAPGGVPGGTLLGTSSNVLSQATWYYIEIVVTVDNTVGSVEVYVDGSKSGWIDLSGIDTQSTANAYANAFGFGSSSNGTSQYFDDVYCKSDGTRFGPGACRSYLPDANGAVRQWTPSTGANDYAVVDEIPPNGDTDYLESTAAADVVTLGFPAIGTTNAIKAVQVLTYGKTTTSGTIRAVSRISGTNYFGTSRALGSSYAYLANIWQNSPATSSPWTDSEIDGAEFGVEHET